MLSTCLYVSALEQTTRNVWIPISENDWSVSFGGYHTPLKKNPSRRAPDRVCAPTRFRDTAGDMNVYLEG